MARIVKEPDVRRDEILETARKLFYSRGYRKTTVQDIVKTLGIAQGTFYYYFKSKTHILDKIIDKLMEDIITKIKEIIDEDLDAAGKLNKLFTATASVKMAHRDTMVTFLRVLYRDENIPLRNKMNEQAVRKTAPLYAEVINQGIREGLFHVPYPDEAGEMIMEIILSSNQAISRLILQKSDGKKKLAKIRQRITMFTHTVEKMLGTPPGTFQGFDMNQVKEILSAFGEKA